MDTFTCIACCKWRVTPQSPPRQTTTPGRARFCRYRGTGAVFSPAEPTAWNATVRRSVRGRPSTLSKTVMRDARDEKLAHETLDGADNNLTLHGKPNNRVTLHAQLSTNHIVRRATILGQDERADEAATLSIKANDPKRSAGVPRPWYSWTTAPLGLAQAAGFGTNLAALPVGSRPSGTPSHRPPTNHNKPRHLVTAHQHPIFRSAKGSFVCGRLSLIYRGAAYTTPPPPPPPLRRTSEEAPAQVGFAHISPRHLHI